MRFDRRTFSAGLLAAGATALLPSARGATSPVSGGTLNWVYYPDPLGDHRDQYILGNRPDHRHQDQRGAAGL